MSLTMGIPMLTQIYQENDPASEPRDLFSKTVMLRVFAAAAGMNAWWVGKWPSTLLHFAASSKPLHGMRHARSDKIFPRKQAYHQAEWTLVCKL